MAFVTMVTFAVVLSFAIVLSTTNLQKKMFVYLFYSLSVAKKFILAKSCAL